MKKIICETKEIVYTYDDYLKTNHWKHKRSIVRKKYKNACAECGSGINLHVHHISYKNIGHEKINELILLCDICHTEEHNREIRKYKVGKNLPYYKKQTEVKVETNKRQKTIKSKSTKIVSNKINEKTKNKILDNVCNKYGEFPSTVSKISFLRSKNRKVILKSKNKIECKRTELLVYDDNNRLLEIIKFKESIK